MTDPRQLADTLDLSLLTREQSLEMRAVAEAAFRQMVADMIRKAIAEATGRDVQIRRCEWCGNPVPVGGGYNADSKPIDTKYCTTNCRVAACRERCKDDGGAVS